MTTLKAFFILAFTLLLLSCGGDKFDQKSYNFLAEEVKMEINKLSIPCPVNQKEIAVRDLDNIVIKGLEDTEEKLILYKNYILMIDQIVVHITPNKTTKDGFQFAYWTDLTEYQLDSKPIITRDAGTIWMYCDDHKKYNSPKKEPLLPTSNMTTVD